ncbi:MAG: lysophospholipid acyltransferase family protein [Candidatus Dormibacteria bacterium]
MAFRVADAILGHLPRPLSYALVTLVASLVLRLHPQRYAGLAANLRRVMPAASEAQFQAILRANVRNHAMAWVDFFRISRLSERRKRALLTVEGEGHMQEVLKDGKGVVIASIHLGAWEGCVGFWGGTRSYRTGLIAEVIEPPELWRRLRARREASGVEVIPLGRSAARDLLRRLKENGVVVGAMDRDLLGSGRPFPFFGAEAPIPTGLIEVAQRTGAGIIPTFCLRDRVFGYRLVGMAPIMVGAGAEGVDAAARKLIAQFENFIRRYPEQWHVLAPIWPEHPSSARASRTKDASEREEVPVG